MNAGFRVISIGFELAVLISARESLYVPTRIAVPTFIAAQKVPVAFPSSPVVTLTGKLPQVATSAVATPDNARFTTTPAKDLLSDFDVACTVIVEQFFVFASAIYIDAGAALIERLTFAALRAEVGVCGVPDLAGLPCWLPDCWQPTKMLAMHSERIQHRE